MGCMAPGAVWSPVPHASVRSVAARDLIRMRNAPASHPASMHLRPHASRPCSGRLLGVQRESDFEEVQEARNFLVEVRHAAPAAPAVPSAPAAAHWSSCTFPDAALWVQQQQALFVLPQQPVGWGRASTLMYIAWQACVP